MGIFRHLLTRRRGLALLIALAALAMKLLVPAGYMPMASGGSIALALCSGNGPEMVAMPGMGDRHGQGDRSGKAQPPCGFAGHAPPSLASADPIPLVLGTLLAVAAIFRAALTRAAAKPGFLRPPSRGPPTII